MKYLVLLLTLALASLHAADLPKSITENGTYTHPTYVGKRYVVSVSGTFGGGSLAINWSDGTTGTAYTGSPATAAKSFTFTAASATAEFILTGATTPALTVSLALVDTNVITASEIDGLGTAATTAATDFVGSLKYIDPVDALFSGVTFGNPLFQNDGQAKTASVSRSSEFSALSLIAGASNLTTAERVGWSNAITTLKATTAWAKISELWVPVGADLTTALVKTKTTGAASMVATSMVAGDYTRAGGINTAAGSGKYLSTNFVPSSSGLGAGEQGMGIYSLSDTWTAGVLGGTDGSGGNINYIGYFSNGLSYVQSTLKSHGLSRGLKWIQQRAGNLETGHNGIIYDSAAMVAAQAIGNIRILSAAGSLYGNASIGGYVYAASMTPAEWGYVARFFETVNRACGRAVRTPSSICFAGDSIVNGYLVGAGEKWTSLVSASLELTETNDGLSGYSMSNETNASNFFNHSTGSYKKVFSNRFKEKMVINYGVNDMNSSGTLANFEDDYRTVLAAVIDDGNYDPRNIILCSPPWVAAADANFLESRQFAFADVVKALSEEFGTKFVDMTRGALYGQTSGFQGDLIHPNAAGHALLASDFLAAISE